MSVLKPVSDEKEIAKYQRDESSAFAGRAEHLYLPETEAELCAIIRSLNSCRTRFTVSGSGTGITGSRCPVHGGAVIATDRFVRPQTSCPDGFAEVREQGFTVYLNAEAKTVIAPAGILLSTLDSMVSGHNLLYPPDPTEMTAMLGGSVATNASGARSFFYGATRVWIKALRIVLPTGDVFALSRGEVVARGATLDLQLPTGLVRVPIPAHSDYPMPDIKNAAGLYLKPGMDAIDLFIGSEGLLGCFTDITLQLADRISQTLTVVGYFSAEADALSFVDAGVRKVSPLPYLSLEYFDEGALSFIRKKYPDVPHAAAAVLFELPYEAHEQPALYPSAGMLKRIENELHQYRANSNWSVPSPNRESIRQFRHSLPEVVNEYMRCRSGKIGTDMAVPHGAFREMMSLYHQLSRAAEVPYVIFGHIGNDHVHLNYLPDDAVIAKRAKDAYSKLARKAVAFGGTVSAEHGVGKKTVLDESGAEVPYLQVMYGAAGLALIAGIKKQFDPFGLMNAGNMVPVEMLDRGME